MDEKSIPLSWDDKAEVCQQWQASGLSIRKFCKQKKLLYLHSKLGGIPPTIPSIYVA